MNATASVAEEQEARIEGFARRVPMKRAGSVDDIANAILFLASDEAAYITRPGDRRRRGVSGPMNYETILYEVADRTATITFNRPEIAQRGEPRRWTGELRDAYARAEADDDVWTIIVTANGRAFCSGADVEGVPDDGKVPHEGRYLSHFREWEAPQEATPPFRSMAKPIIVAVNGICCGAGLDLVTTGDIAIASDRAQFFDPHVSIGLVSGREMVRVARTIPINVAMRMALLGKQERLSAQRAFELGLITEVVEHDQLADPRLRDRRHGQPERAARGARAPASPSARASGSRSTKPSCSPRRSASGCCTPTTPTKGRARSSSTATRMEVRVSDVTYETIQYEVDADDRVATITLNRPEALNAFNRQMCEEIRDVVARR